MVETKDLNVRLAADVKASIVAAAAERGKSFNDAAVEVLADHFRVPFDGTGRPSSGTRTEDGPVLLRVPPRLYRKIHSAAVPPRSKRELVDSIFRAHYRLGDAAAV